jgi:hypothetical protein
MTEFFEAILPSLYCSFRLRLVPLYAALVGRMRMRGRNRRGVCVSSCSQVCACECVLVCVCVCERVLVCLLVSLLVCGELPCAWAIVRYHASRCNVSATTRVDDIQQQAVVVAVAAAVAGRGGGGGGGGGSGARHGPVSLWWARSVHHASFARALCPAPARGRSVVTSNVATVATTAAATTITVRQMVCEPTLRWST